MKLNYERIHRRAVLAREILPQMAAAALGHGPYVPAAIVAASFTLADEFVTNVEEFERVGVLGHMDCREVEP